MARDGTLKLYTEIDQSGAKKGFKGIEEGAKKSAKSQAATLAAVYRKQGYSASDAFTKAWSEVERTTESGGKKVTEKSKKWGLKAGDGFATGYSNKIASKLASTIARLGAVIAIAFSIGKIVEFGKASLQAVSDLEAANTGLLSLMNGQGKSFKDANKFINEYISDGLIPATNAINAYKNLSLRGYDTSQIEEVMTALKDSSAFARQSSLSMGDAVQSASEGLKNENSLLVDNAGVTKNVAQMWKEYAATIGTTANSLTKQQKIQAEVNGILEETKFQVGDATRITQTYQGQVLALQFAVNNLKIAFGNFLKPITQAVIPVISTLVNWLTRLFNILAQVSALLFGTSKSFGSQAQQQQAVADSGSSAAKSQEALASGTKKAAKEAKGALAAFDELNVLQKDSGGAGASGGGAPSADGGAGGGEFTPETLPQMEIDPKIAEIVERLKAALEPTIEALKRLGEALEPLKEFAAKALTDFYEHFLKPVGSWVMGEGLPRFIDAITNGLQQINWGKINDALVSLWTALTPFAINVGEGLLWLWENVLVPFGTWAIGDVLPVFLELLASALDLLNARIEEAKPYFQALWDNLLQPAAEWTGGKIVEALSFLKEQLDKIGQWVKDHQPEFEKLAKKIGDVAAKLWDFIEPIADKAWELLKDAIAGIVDGFLAFSDWALEHQGTIETLGIIVGSFAAAWGLVSVAMGIASVATGIWSVVGGIGAAVTTALGTAVAFLTSPIIIVTVVIGALIAAVILLVKNWDKVKEVASKVWEKIKEVWNGVATWFSTTVIEPLVNFFTGLYEKIQEIFNNVINFFTVTFVNKWNDIWGGVKDTFKNMWDSFVDIVKTPINSIIGFINGMVNAVVGGVNFIIRALNRLSFDIPGIGGQSFGFDISEVTPPQIPYLASGAVLPPNKPFMAMVGDQKQGTNIEAPLSTIEEAVSNVLAPLLIELIEATKNNQVVVTLDGEVIFKSNQKIGHRKGINLVAGGGRA